MKKLFILFFALSFFSCKENMPDVPPFPDTPSERKVLIEEFTGVGCVQCPGGSIALENLISIYGDNLVVVSIHAGDFVNPLPQSNYNFKTQEGEDLINYLDSPPFYPSAVINRKDYDGGFYRIQYGVDEWAGFIGEELTKDPKISVNLFKTYDAATRELSVQVSGIALENLTGDLRLTVMISESNIIDAQLDQAQGGLVEDYVHKHVFRTTMTPFDGESFASQMDEGDNYDIQKTMTLPEEWNAEECEIIAFVNLVDGQNKDVLQAESTHVED